MKRICLRGLLAAGTLLLLAWIDYPGMELDSTSAQKEPVWCRAGWIGMPMEELELTDEQRADAVSLGLTTKTWVVPSLEQTMHHNSPQGAEGRKRYVVYLSFQGQWTLEWSVTETGTVKGYLYPWESDLVYAVKEPEKWNDFCLEISGQGNKTGAAG